MASGGGASTASSWLPSTAFLPTWHGSFRSAWIRRPCCWLVPWHADDGSARRLRPTCRPTSQRTADFAAEPGSQQLWPEIQSSRSSHVPLRRGSVAVGSLVGRPCKSARRPLPDEERCQGGGSSSHDSQNSEWSGTSVERRSEAQRRSVPALRTQLEERRMLER